MAPSCRIYYSFPVLTSSTTVNNSVTGEDTLQSISRSLLLRLSSSSRALAKSICDALNEGCSPCILESDVQWQLPPHSLCSRCDISAEAVKICVIKR